MCWNQFDDFVNDIDYFQEKILCHSRPFFVYDQEQAEEDITKYIEEYNLYDDILSNGYDFLCDKTEVIEAFLTDVLWDFTLETGIGSNGYDKFSEIDGDICDIISDFGKRETGILDLYMLAFKLAKRTAKNKQRRLGGKIMNYAWDANCDGIEITEEDVDYLMKAIDLALHRIKQKNKEKYTPKKYK